MKKIICTLLAAVMLLSSALILVGCGAPEDPGAEIAVYLGNEVYDFDPTDYYANSNAEQLMSLLFEPLFYINEKGKLKCAAAEDYEVDEEKREISILLRETYWSDGTRVKAEDFVYAWCERLLAPGMPNPAAALLYDIENALAVKSGEGSISDIKVRATGIYELSITYREGADYEQLLRNLASVATAPVRQDIVATLPTVWSKSVNRVFNGPFQINFLDAVTGELTLARNLGYHQSPETKDYDDEVRPSKLVALLTPDGNEVSVSYADIASKVTFFMGDATLADRAANKSRATVKDDASTYCYVFNTQNPLFKDARVRQALSLAIDRNAIVSATVFGKAANGFVPDAFGGSSDNSYISGSANKTRALELLAEVDLSGIDKNVTLTVNDDEESRAIAAAVKSCWEDLGIGLTVNVQCAEVASVEMPDRFVYNDSGIQVALKEASYGNVEYDVLAVDWQMYTDDPFVALSAFASGFSGMGVDFSTLKARTNVAGWVNTDYDYLINAAFTSSDKEQRSGYLKEAEKLLCEECPIIPIMFNESFCFISDELSRIEFDGFGNYIFTDCKQKNYQDYLPKNED